jgi:hypothetical protein
MINRQSGNLEVQGSIYDAAFQESLNQQGFTLDLSDTSCQPIRGAVKEDIVMSSTVTQEGDFSIESEEYVCLSFLLARHHLNTTINQPIHLCEGPVPIPGRQARRPSGDAQTPAAIYSPGQGSKYYPQGEPAEGCIPRRQHAHVPRVLSLLI